MTAFDKIIKWNESRNNVNFDVISEYQMLNEELTEFLTAHNEENEHEMVDALCDIIVVATGGLYKLGYDPNKAMDEVIKHISSREQDPIQKQQWEENGAEGKWLKRKAQDKTQMYQQDFESCKL